MRSNPEHLFKTARGRVSNRRRAAVVVKISERPLQYKKTALLEDGLKATNSSNNLRWTKIL